MSLSRDHLGGRNVIARAQTRGRREVVEGEVRTQAGAGLTVLGPGNAGSLQGLGEAGNKLPDSCCKQGKHLLQPAQEPFLDFQLP